MSEKREAAPGWHPGAASEDNVVALKDYSGSGKPKTGRTRYVRFFPERLYFLVVHLTEREMVAYLRFVAKYVVGNGAPKDEPKALAPMVGLSAAAWTNLRTKLIEMGVIALVDGHLVDEDQQKNLDIQRKTSERQARIARKKWGTA
jgi:hypothetical protein